MSEPPKSLYVHIPFCAQKCLYCAFNSEAGASVTEMDDYVEALIAELATLADGCPLDLETIYVGGGTPTALAPRQLSRVLFAIRARLGSTKPLEWTVEMNPGTATEATVDVLLGAGVDRISMGVQSFDSRRLKALGRLHTADDVTATVATLRRRGFERFNLDLIYGLPKQTLDDWNRDLDRLLEFEPGHASLYALQYEEGTPYGDAHARGRLNTLDDDLVRAMFGTARERLAGAGLSLYEISNFAAPGRRSLHNQRYWRNEAYYGIGAGAYSRIANERRRNEADRRRYVAALRERNHAIEERDRLGPREDYVETLSSGLRTVDGVSRRTLFDRSGIDLIRAHASWIERLASTGLATFDGDRLILTEDGLWVLDTILEPFLEVATPVPGP